MTSQGTPWTRFRRALDHGNLVEARSAANELEHVGLAEALELTLLIAQKEPDRLERTALRLHARAVAELRLGATQAQALLALLLLLPDPQAAMALAHLLDRRGLGRACEALLRAADGEP